MYPEMGEVRTDEVLAIHFTHKTQCNSNQLTSTGLAVPVGHILQLGGVTEASSKVRQYLFPYLEVALLLPWSWKIG